MAKLTAGKSWARTNVGSLTLLCLFGGLAGLTYVMVAGSMTEFEPAGLATASRTINQLAAVLATCIALIIPLTSNLYTPKLVPHYVTHPLIVVGLLVHLLGMLLALALNYFPREHPFHIFGAHMISLIYLVAVAGALPFLFGISQFLRPSYFLPMLTRKGIQDQLQMERGRNLKENAKGFFETVNVLTNIALTGMNRGDRQLVLLSLKSLNTLLSSTLASGLEPVGGWRGSRPFFVPGLALEGQAHLVRERSWPEAYILAQMLKVTEGASKRQHEILAEQARYLVETAELAQALGRDAVVELHVMAFNTLMREAVEEQDLRRFQNLSYHYRLLIEVFHEAPDRMHDATQQLLHYARMAQKQGLHFGMETVMYDMGELTLCLAKRDQEKALELVRVWAGPLWQQSLGPGSSTRKAGWRTLLRVYWEARAAGQDSLAELLHWSYLFDDTIHREQLEWVLDENRELHFEFNDRLMRFAYLTPEAVALAREFCEQPA